MRVQDQINKWASIGGDVSMLNTETRRVAYTDADGNFRLMHPNDKCGLTFDEIIAKDIPEGLEYDVIESDDLPDIDFIRSWEFKGKGQGIFVNMEKAREIWRARIKEHVESRMIEFRDAYDKAIDEGGDVSAIVAKRKALRAFIDHPGIDLAKTPEDLKAIWPSAPEFEV